MQSSVNFYSRLPKHNLIPYSFFNYKYFFYATAFLLLIWISPVNAGYRACNTVIPTTFPATCTCNDASAAIVANRANGNIDAATTTGITKCTNPADSVCIGSVGTDLTPGSPPGISTSSTTYYRYNITGGDTVYWSCSFTNTTGFTAGAGFAPYVLSIGNPINGSENSGGSVVNAELTVRVTPTNTTGAPITGSVSWSGTATQGIDYLTPLTTFSIPNNSATATLTIQPIDDDMVEPNETVTATITSTTVITNPASASATADIISNDIARITITPTSGLVTTEAGGTATFTVVLNSQPSANVTVPLSSTDITEGTVSAANLIFTSANWKASQTVTITGVDDPMVDGAVPYSIVTAVASVDVYYSVLNPSDVAVSNSDDDVAGITVTTSDLVTTEDGAATTFTVVLNSQPSADVKIALSSLDTTEGSVGPAELTFTSANWNTAQTVTVTGVDDFIADDTVSYRINVAVASSDDAHYASLDPKQISLNNFDNDSAGLVITTPTADLVTSEAGGKATFTIKLGSQPSANVTIQLESLDTTEGTIDFSDLTFTSVNWNTEQTVTVTGVNDFIIDDTIDYIIRIKLGSSTDPSYAGLDPRDVPVSNTDNDIAGITINPTSDLVTTEAGGTATFSVVLNSEPSDNVTVPLSSSNINEGTISAANLIFTSANWNVPQTVTITGEDDPSIDGAVAYTILTAKATSTDANYRGLNPSDVTVSNRDDDGYQLSIAKTTDGAEPNTAGRFTVTVSPANATGAAITGTVAYSGTATKGTDYTAPVSFGIPNGSSTATLDFTVKDDTAIEGTETVIATISNPSIGAISTAAATANLADNYSYTLAIAKTTDGAEPNTAGRFTVTVSPANATGAAITGTVAYSGTASGTDYTAPPASFSIPNGSSTATLDFTVTDDTAVEGTETVMATIANPSIGTITTAAATANLADDDVETNHSVSITQASNGAEPNTAGQFTVTVSPANNTGAAITGTVAYSGTATQGTDYTAPTSFGIPNGESSITIPFTVVNDTEVEGTETLIATITLATPAGTLKTASTAEALTLGSNSANAVINDDDSSTAIPIFSPFGLLALLGGLFWLGRRFKN